MLTNMALPKKAITYSSVLSVLALSLTFSTPVLAEEKCTADPKWFPHSQTKEPDNGSFSSSSNCEFHQWSWQMFLWLTQNDRNTEQPRFLSFKSPEVLLASGDKSTKDSALMPRTTKSNDVHSLDEIDQAGSDAVLVDKNGKVIYYSQHINQKFVDFVAEHGLNNPEKVRKFPADKSFDIGVIELKASWKIVADGEDTTNFFTTTNDVYKLTNKGGKIHIDRTQTENVKLALVGLHIGGVVKGHPEMIWATFEHNKNAPNVSHGTQPTDIVSSNDFTFYKGGTPYNGCNVNVGGRQLLDEATQKLSPVTQVCRQYQYGNTTLDCTNKKKYKSATQVKACNKKKERIKKNDSNIEALNASVKKELGSGLWSNYAEVGAIWFVGKNSLGPNMALDRDAGNISTYKGEKKEANLIGSFKLSNSTIETFTQTQSTKDNCFRCHNTQQQIKDGYDSLPGLNLNISHTFVNLYFRSQKQK